MHIETERLTITELREDMAEIIRLQSMDEDNRRFVPDEVFETVEQAREAVAWLISCYQGSEGPFVYPMLLKSGENIGYVQAVPMEEGFEIGYHVAKPHTGKGYATEAVSAFLPVIMRQLGISELLGVCLADNLASQKVLGRCGFVLEYAGPGMDHGREQMIRRYRYSLPK